MVISNPGRDIAQLVTLATEVTMARPINRSTRSALLQMILEKQSASVYGLVLIATCGLLGMTQTIPNGLIVPVVVLTTMAHWFDAPSRNWIAAGLTRVEENRTPPISLV